MEETSPPDHEEAVPHYEILWLLECREEDYFWYQFVPLYAVSREEAEQKAQQWIERNRPRTFTQIDLHAHPEGFVIHRSRLPGKRER